MLRAKFKIEEGAEKNSLEYYGVTPAEILGQLLSCDFSVGNFSRTSNLGEVDRRHHLLWRCRNEDFLTIKELRAFVSDIGTNKVRCVSVTRMKAKELSLALKQRNESIAKAFFRHLAQEVVQLVRNLNRGIFEKDLWREMYHKLEDIESDNYRIMDDFNIVRNGISFEEVIPAIMSMYRLESERHDLLSASSAYYFHAEFFKLADWANECGCDLLSGDNVALQNAVDDLIDEMCQSHRSPIVRVPDPDGNAYGWNAYDQSFTEGIGGLGTYYTIRSHELPIEISKEEAYRIMENRDEAMPLRLRHAVDMFVSDVHPVDPDFESMFRCGGSEDDE